MTFDRLSPVCIIRDALKTRLGGLTVLALLAGLPSMPPAWAEAGENSAVVMMYHRFGAPRLPSTNIAMADFKAHVKEASSGRYVLRALEDITADLRQGKVLADRTIGFSVDDAYISFYRRGWPLLRQAGIPVTLFVSTTVIDQNSPGFMSWDQIRELVAQGVTIGSQTATHPHLPALEQSALDAELRRSNQRFEAELGKRPRLIAYPYGEYGLREIAAAKRAGFVAGFGQHSGVIHGTENRFGLPRFSMNEQFGSLQRFRLAANALPLHAREVTPADTVLRGDNPPAIGLTIDTAVRGLGNIKCYASHQPGTVRIEQLGQRLEIRFRKTYPPGRGRINCTLFAGKGRWRWWGRQFYIPRR